MESIYYSSTLNDLIIVTLFLGRMLVKTSTGNNYSYGLKSGTRFLLENNFEIIGYL